MPPNTDFTDFVWYVVRQVTLAYAKISEEIVRVVKTENQHGMENEDSPKIRVTDRRHARFDGDEENHAGDRENPASPNLKPSYVEELEARARDAEAKTADVQHRFEQVRAELNHETAELRARLQRTADERVTTEKAAFIAGLLPVVDNLTRAIQAAESGTSVENLLEGLRGTLNGFEAALMAAGVEPIPAIGEQFNPELHEAVDTVEGTNEGRITAEYGRGFRLGARLLRPARVQVGRARGIGSSVH
ncbi:MAG: nucleotide exchange factor GrpE [Pyrinomonadaceae bacterium MAG19_C2-C3]|nr:nucleotide exchange factor GrpE [Pyrinomonadaceae bacterium MAG19_C2-C3]